MDPTSRLAITTIMGCPNGCRFCPQSLMNHRYATRGGPRLLTLENFRACLASVPRAVRIDLSGMTEPWQNPAATDMLIEAAARGHQVAVYTTLNGLTPTDFDRMQELTYDFFVNHLPDAEGYTRIPVTAAYLKLLERIVNTPLAITGERQFSCHGTLHPAVAPIVAGTFPVYSTMIDRAGLLCNPGLAGAWHTGPLTCARSGAAFNQNILMPDGSVLACCMDFGLEYVLGNLLTQDYASLFTGPAHAALQQALADDRLKLMCRRCTTAVAAAP